MNEKKPLFIAIYIMFSICIIGLCLCSFTGCATTRPIDEELLQYQRKVDLLKTRLRLYEQQDRTIREGLSELSRRAESIDNGIGDVIVLFDEYYEQIQRVIEQLSKRESNQQSID